MDPVASIALAAFLLSVLTFAATQFGTKRTAAASYVTQLEARVKKLEEETARKDIRIVELEAENLRLMRKLIANGTHP
jgi:outer membrane murein-binding lipoprotein Lpp